MPKDTEQDVLLTQIILSFPPPSIPTATALQNPQERDYLDIITPVDSNVHDANRKSKPLLSSSYHIIIITSLFPIRQVVIERSHKADPAGCAFLDSDTQMPRRLVWPEYIIGMGWHHDPWRWLRRDDGRRCEALLLWGYTSKWVIAVVVILVVGLTYIQVVVQMQLPQRDDQWMWTAALDNRGKRLICALVIQSWEEWDGQGWRWSDLMVSKV